MKQISLVIVGLALALFLFEILFRLYPGLSAEIDLLNGKPVVQHLSYLYPDKDIGYVLQPNLKAKIRKNPFDGEGYYLMTIGEDGFRQSTERLSPARIAFVGDSFTFGTGVDDPETFAEHLGRLAKVTVKNFGIPGANFAMEAEVIKKYVLPWSPTHIVWCFFEENDLGQNQLFYRWQETGSKNTFYYDNFTSGDWRRIFIRKAKSFLGRHVMISALFKSLYRSWTGEKMKPEYLTGIRTDVSEFRMALHEPLLANSLSGRKPLDPQEWEVIVREFENVVALTRRAGIPLTLVLLPRREHIYMPMSNHPRGDKVTRLSHNGAKEHFALLLKGDRAVPLLDLIEHFWNIAPNLGPLYFTVDGHFNEKGNEEAARFILKHIF